MSSGSFFEAIIVSDTFRKWSEATLPNFKTEASEKNSDYFSETIFKTG